MMYLRDIWIKSAGGILSGLGLLLIVLSGELGPGIIEGIGYKNNWIIL
ncbi:MAG: hypothetical protein ACMUIG_06070 [Thermoplasmatota archaeon]